MSWRRLRSGVLAAALHIAFVVAAQAMTTQQYVAALDSIRHSDATAARTKAQQLIGAEIEAPAGRFTADGALLHEIMANPTAARPHLAATIAALRNATPSPATVADPQLLERLRAEETATSMKVGGEIRTAPPGDEKALEATASGVAKAWRWVKRKIDQLANWFARWWPKSTSERKAAKATSPKWIVTIVVIAIVLVLAVLAFEVVRRSRGGPAQEMVTSDPVVSRRDEDPLSRGATEWERYAAQLAAAGRTREAIRAWYHAVLVTLYAAAILHFKKGRTNWEYIAALSPDIAWRSDFVALTRRFENEWYGHEHSSAEALDDVAARARGILDLVRRRAAA